MTGRRDPRVRLLQARQPSTATILLLLQAAKGRRRTGSLTHWPTLAKPWPVRLHAPSKPCGRCETATRYAPGTDLMRSQIISATWMMHKNWSAHGRGRRKASDRIAGLLLCLARGIQPSARFLLDGVCFVRVGG